MASTAPTIAPLRVRIFVDFWNFSLSIRRENDAFMIDWKPVAAALVAEAAQLLGAPVT